MMQRATPSSASVGPLMTASARSRTSALGARVQMLEVAEADLELEAGFCPDRRAATGTVRTRKSSFDALKLPSSFGTNHERRSRAKTPVETRSRLNAQHTPDLKEARALLDELSS